MFNFFKKDKKPEVDNKTRINDVIKWYDQLINYCGEYSEVDYKIKSNPTIHHEMPNVFQLSPAVEPEEIKQSVYVDRVLIKETYTDAQVESILQQMFEALCNHQFYKEVDVRFKSFQMPGTSGFLRENERPGIYEIRLCAMGFKKEQK